MTHHLAKGGNCVLAAAGEPGFATAVGITWNDPAADLDVVALLCGPDKRVLSDAHFLFWNQPTCPQHQVFLRWVNRGEPAPNVDRAQVLFNLADLDPAIEHIYLALSTIAEDCVIASGGGFSVSVHNLTQGVEHAAYRSVTQYARETCAIFAEVYRYKGQWKLRIHDAGYSAGLAAFGQDYGVNID
ncbi:MAG: TerD family protein [Kineosporiaceae bacterium]|nr:TerD family protein [Kineosporiaceae bacterium]MBK7624417.1 TerD family protein [Kineosporiaceae bacterium]MBK8077781.1 TerD family protein [Kineosporiaceae bacterium]